MEEPTSPLHWFQQGPALYRDRVIVLLAPFS